MTAARCKALMVSAPASGQGKTTVTAALARLARDKGLRVRVFKAGPDFIDPMILEKASGHPVYQLDLWMGGEAHCRRLLHDAAINADLLLVEGVMGLYDGVPSSAHLAKRLDLPVLAVIDASAMAETFGALTLGLSRYHPNLRFHGVFANRTGGERHTRMLASSVPETLRFLGALPRSDQFELPERHLGLMQAVEISDLIARIDAAADAMNSVFDIDAIPITAFSSTEPENCPRLLDGLRIAVARDTAFSFLYQANLDTLRQLGARLTFFSPLAGDSLPATDAVYLPGGYPELHAAQLSANDSFRRALVAHHAAVKPLVAECGGMMVLFEMLIDRDGKQRSMAGLLPGTTAMQPRLQALALQSVATEAGELRGHTFHHSCLDTTLQPALRGYSPQGAGGEAVYQVGALTASYIHFYFPSNPRAVARLFRP